MNSFAHPRSPRRGVRTAAVSASTSVVDHDGFRDYLRAIAPTPLLTRPEEIALARRIELAADAARRLQEGAGATTRLARLTAAERRALVALVEDGREATRAFACANLRLVISLARRYVGHGLGLPDLVQEGNLGLLTAVRKFAWRKGNRFSTYASWWIRQALERAIADQGRTVRLPVHMHDAVGRMRRRRDALRRALGRDPRPDELATALGIAGERLVRIVAADRRMLSLDAPLGTGRDDGTNLGALLADDGPTPAKSTEAVLLVIEIEHALRGLDAREAHVLRRRFGLNGAATATLADLGTELGLSRERVRQIERVALEKLRAPALRARLEHYREADRDGD